MKRFVFLTMLAALLFALALPAAADVAYMPRDDFLMKHMDECSYENRWYYANGSEGYVLAYRSPESSDATPLPNGNRYLITNIYQGSWGVLEYDTKTLENSESSGSVVGWVKLDQMVAEYDNVAFRADHAGELTECSDELEIAEDQTVYAYQYPGSGIVVAEFSGDWATSIPFQQAFTDPAGRKWGYCGYLFGVKNFWVCLDDPFNAELAPDENRVEIRVTEAKSDPEETAPETPGQTDSDVSSGNTTDPLSPAKIGKTISLTPAADAPTISKAAVKNARSRSPYIAAAAAGVVVIAAAVLVVTLRKKQKQK